jgi:tctex1 domain-containing protein 2
MPRYKYMVQVVVGEQRGEGIRVGCRTLWDSDTDAYANATFMNDNLFCCATAYAMYLY